MKRHLSGQSPRKKPREIVVEVFERICSTLVSSKGSHVFCKCFCMAFQIENRRMSKTDPLWGTRDHLLPYYTWSAARGLWLVLAVMLCAQHVTSTAGTEDIALAHLLTRGLPEFPRAILGCCRTKSATFVPQDMNKRNSACLILFLL